MSITFRYLEDLSYVITLTEKEMGYLHSHLKEDEIKLKFNQNQNFQIIKKRRSVGFVSFRMEEDFLFLDLIVLDQEAQHQGIGKKVIKRMESEAVKKKKKAIYLYVSKDNQQGISAFQKYGFSITDQGRKYWVMERPILSKETPNELEGKYLRIHYPL